MSRAYTDAGVALLLDEIYDAAVAPERWPAVLEHLAGLFNSNFADLYARTDDSARCQGIVFGLDPSDYADQFLGTWVKRNVWGKTRPTRIPGEVLSTRQIVAKPDLLRSEIYNEYLHPRGLHEGLRLAIWADEGWVQDISLLRPWSAGPFEGEEIALAETLLPHIQRAAGVTRRMRHASAAAQAGFAALDTLQHAAILLGASGRALLFNRAADRLLTEADGLLVAGQEVTTSSEGARRRLRAAIAMAAGPGGHAPRSATLTVPRPSGRADLMVTIMPVPEAGGWMSLHQPGALLLVSDPHAKTTLTATAVSRRFGLTESECGLALDLLAGHSVAAIAARRGRSVHTVRTHLARLMGKTHTNRQSDLLRVLMMVSQTEEPAGPLAGGVEVRLDQ